MPLEVHGQLVAQGQRFGVVVSRFNDFITTRLQDGAVEALRRHGAIDDNITVVHVPGAFEIPLVAKRMAQSGHYDAVICLGCIIRGATPHFEYIAAHTARGVSDVGMQTGLPVVFGVITADTLEQAIDRAGAKSGNKGAEAALTAIEMVNLMAQIKVDAGK
jgi:6,7-dimethyl-8-ribityllumazine synthase